MSLEPQHPQEPTAPSRGSLEYTTKWVGTWWAPILVALGTLFWCFLIYFLIGTRTRQWEYGTVPYVPGSSIYTSGSPAKGKVHPQVQLPQAIPGGSSETR